MAVVLDPFQTIIEVGWGGCDYIVVRFAWFDGSNNGARFDSYTRSDDLIPPMADIWVGQSESDDDPTEFILLVGRAFVAFDTYRESHLINLKKIRETMPDLEEFVLDTAGTWDGNFGQGGFFTLSLDRYRGAAPTKDPNTSDWVFTQPALSGGWSAQAYLNPTVRFDPPGAGRIKPFRIRTRDGDIFPLSYSEDIP